MRYTQSRHDNNMAELYQIKRTIIHQLLFCLNITDGSFPFENNFPPPGWHCFVITAQNFTQKHRFLPTNTGDVPIGFYLAIYFDPLVMHVESCLLDMIGRQTSLSIWVLPKIRVHQNGWFIMESPFKMNDLGVPLFLETPIWWKKLLLVSGRVKLCHSSWWYGHVANKVTWRIYHFCTEFTGLLFNIYGNLSNECPMCKHVPCV